MTEDILTEKYIGKLTLRDAVCNSNDHRAILDSIFKVLTETFVYPIVDGDTDYEEILHSRLGEFEDLIDSDSKILLISLWRNAPPEIFSSTYKGVDLSFNTLKENILPKIALGKPRYEFTALCAWLEYISAPNRYPINIMEKLFELCRVYQTWEYNLKLSAEPFDRFEVYSKVDTYQDLYLTLGDLEHLGITQAYIRKVYCKEKAKFPSKFQVMRLALDLAEHVADLEVGIDVDPFYAKTKLNSLITASR